MVVKKPAARAKTAKAVEPVTVAEPAAEPVTVELGRPGLVRAVEGDSYLTLAERYSDGESVVEFARLIHDLNGGVPVRAGTLLALPV